MLIQYCKKGVLSVLLVCGAWAGGFAQEWNLVWSEEFDRDGKLDEAVWNYENGLHATRKRSGTSLTMLIARMENW